MLALAQPSTLQELWVFFPLKLHWTPPWLATSCLTFVEELVGSPICVVSASYCNSGIIGSLCARPYHAPKI